MPVMCLYILFFVLFLQVATRPGADHREPSPGKAASALPYFSALAAGLQHLPTLCLCVEFSTPLSACRSETPKDFSFFSSVFWQGGRGEGAAPSHSWLCAQGITSNSVPGITPGYLLRDSPCYLWGLSGIELWFASCRASPATLGLLFWT